MFFGAIIRDYFIWHYVHAWWQMWGLWRNCMWFVIHYFSLPQLTRSWFAPYKRITESRGKKLDFESIASYVIINLLSRIVGGLIRTVIIIVGLLALVFVIIAGFAVYTFWLLAPFIIISLLGMSLSLFLI